MQQLIPNAKAQFIDSGGQPLASGTVGFYFPGTLNPKPTYQDAAGTIANTNPVQLDSRGQALIWGSGVYRQIVKDASGVTIWDQITEDPNAGLTGNLADDVFLAGDGTGNTFIPGTTTTLTLSAGPGSVNNTWIFFDGVYQTDDQVESIDGTTLTFASPIPDGVREVTVKSGTTVAIGTPADGTVTDTKVAIGSKLYNRIRDIVDVKDFGAKGDGTTDDTAAMQRAHSTGRIVYYPAGKYSFSTITMASGGIIGDGIGQTYLNTTDATAADVISWKGAGGDPLDTSTTSPYFSNFRLTAQANTKTGGSLINLAPSSGEISYAIFENLMFVGGFIQIGTVAASHWNIVDSYFINYSQCGVLVQNTNNNDSGDSTISGCTFNVNFIGQASQAGVLHQSSGGLRVVNNKFLGGNFGYLMRAQLGSTNFADLFIVANSIENMSIAAMQFNRATGTAQLGNIIISDNEFGQNPNNIIMNDATGFLVNISIIGNDFNTIQNGGTGIIFDHNTNCLIANNRFSGSTGSGGISTGANCTRLHIGINQYAVSSPYSVGTPGQTVVDLTPQGGPSVATTSAAFGSLFIGTVAVTFPVPFLIPPSVFGASIVGTGSGGISCACSNVTATGMQVSAIGTTNGGAVSFEWFVQGTTSA